MSEGQVIFSEHETGAGQRIGRATLNAPGALNALNFHMVQALYARLRQWAEDVSIIAVWLEGVGERALCAGGDVVQAYREIQAEPQEPNGKVAEYFCSEYRLDHYLHHYPKPLIVWGTGIVMGGGIGLLAGGNRRIVTETARLAMPEVTIALFPDVGASWFLNRMPGRCGLFLAITGAQFDATDALFLGIADRLIESSRREQVFADLLGVPTVRQAGPAVDAVLRRHARESRAARPKGNVARNYERIQALTDADCDLSMIRQIMDSSEQDSWLAKAAETLRHGSPLVARVIIEQLRRSRYWGLAQVFRSELNLGTRCGQLGEFAEGVRAQLIDKDRKPDWRFKTPETVEQEWIDRFFVPLWTAADHPLRNLRDE